MIVKVRDVKIPLNITAIGLKKLAASKLGIAVEAVSDIRILKKSLDARKKNEICYVETLAVETKVEPARCLYAELYEPEKRLISDLDLPNAKGKKVYVAGSGPAGLFCALTLAKSGASVVLLERGYDVDKRVGAVNALRTLGVLDTKSNVQFGEGGAGTFSDGKLNTGTKDKLIGVVIGEFVKHGAPTETEYQAKPHIGTDYLREVVKNMRSELLELGAEVRFEMKLSDILIKNGGVCGVKLQTSEGETQEDCDTLVLALGHSARDTFAILEERGFNIEQKPFSIGLRVEHLQKKVNVAQYGVDNKMLPPADYKHSAKLDNGRGVYTFCMCPGGEVVCAASEEGALTTNGMSEFSRDKVNANSAVLVSVTPADYGSDKPLAGVEFQRKYERLAYLAGGGNYAAPVQRLDDFLLNRCSRSFGEVKPSYAPNTAFAKLSECLPKFVVESIKSGVKQFDRKMRGFADGDALLTGIEARSSAPIRILRDGTGQSNIAGVYPCGEGAGYAGGITSSAVDGIKTAISIILK